jgi:hypothetical protein
MAFSDNTHRYDELDEMRAYAAAEAEEAGLDADQAGSVVDIAMSAYWEVDGVIDRDHFEDMVASVIQGVANP